MQIQYHAFWPLILANINVLFFLPPIYLVSLLNARVDNIRVWLARDVPPTAFHNLHLHKIIAYMYFTIFCLSDTPYMHVHMMCTTCTCTNLSILNAHSSLANHHHRHTVHHHPFKYVEVNSLWINIITILKSHEQKLSSQIEATTWIFICYNMAYSFNCRESVWTDLIVSFGRYCLLGFRIPYHNISIRAFLNDSLCLHNVMSCDDHVT